MVGVRFLAIEGQGALPFLAAGRSLDVNTERKTVDLLDVEQEVQHVGHAADRRDLRLIPEKEGGGGVQHIGQLIDHSDGDLDLPGFVLLDRAEGFADDIGQFFLVVALSLAKDSDPLTNGGVIVVIHGLFTSSVSYHR